MECYAPRRIEFHGGVNKGRGRIDQPAGVTVGLAPVRVATQLMNSW